MPHSDEPPRSAYSAQSASLIEVQKRWGALETAVREQATCVKGKARYDEVHDLARLQVDGAYPNCDKPALLVSVTHTDPDKPGHSNENKFHLKLGELYLFKTFSPAVLHMLAVGITQAAWAPYVLEAFKLFFDEVPFSWQEDFLDKISGASKLHTKNDAFWRAEAQRRSTITLAKDPAVAPQSALRLKFYKDIVPKFLGCQQLEDIDHVTMKYMVESSAQTSNERGLWFRLRSGADEDYVRLWEDRSYFNPAEATLHLLLREHRIRFAGALAKDVEVPSLLHDFGFAKTKAREDLVLYSHARKQPVYIQSKASGGGKDQHGKNIMNRAKEQVARSVLYRTRRNKDGSLQSGPQGFVWIGILDGDWAKPAKYPLKYVHMLQIAGYDYLFSAEGLVDVGTLNPNHGHQIIDLLLKELDCATLDNTTDAQWKSIEQAFPVRAALETFSETVDDLPAENGPEE